MIQRNNTRKEGRAAVSLRIKAAILCICMLVGVCLTALPGAMAVEDEISENDIENLRNKVKELEQKTAALQKYLEKAEENLATLQSAVGRYSELSESYRQQILTAEKNILQCEESLEQCRADLEKLKDDNVTLYENMKVTLRALREREEPSLLELILDSSDLGELLSGVERAKDLANYKKQALSKINSALTALKQKRADLESTLEKQTAQLAALKALKAESEERIRESEARLTEMAQKVLETQRELSNLEETTEAIQKELADLIKAYQEQEERHRLARQSLLWPLDYPKNVRITSPYGYRYHPLYSSYKFHTGIDMVGPESGDVMYNNIYAAMEGTVILAVEDRGTTGYGSYIIISHGYSERYQGYISTLYAHCETINVKVNDTVKQGQVIATVGTTGASTGYHLHFEVRKDGLTTDPLSYGYITEPEKGEPIDPYTFIVKDY